MKRVVITLLVSVLGLVILSTWSLYSALMLSQKGDLMMRNQIGAVLLGFVGFGAMAWLDYRRLNHWVWVLAVYLGTLALLVAVLIPVSARTATARNAGRISFSPVSWPRPP